MPKTEEYEGAKTTLTSTPVSLLVTVSRPLHPEEVERWFSILGNLVGESGPAYAAFALPLESGQAAPDTSNVPSTIALYTYPAIGNPAAIPGVATNAIYRPLAELAKRLEARAVLILTPEEEIVDPAFMHLLSDPVLDGGNDLCLPIYTIAETDGLLNRAIFSPLVSALYGRKVHFPLAQDFCISSRFLDRLAALPPFVQAEISWPSVEAIAANFLIAEAHVPVCHRLKGDNLDLASILNTLLGSLYSDIEKKAALWQRIRGMQPLRLHGWPAEPCKNEEIEIAPLWDAFLLGSRNLQEIWSMVLPPVALLELKRLSRVTPQQLHLPDGLWSRIIYDFALAYRLRPISRSHLLGALVPLYLGWVASHVQTLSNPEREHSQVDLARTFEESKSYFVSRWRWPDRFNP